jgi:uncharacterized membrane protein
MEPDAVYTIVTNPAWRPFTDIDLPGYVVIAAVAAVLVGFTVWTYLGSAQTTPRRLLLLVLLRLLALVVAILTALRPALAITDQPRIPSTLIIVVDNSESMTFRDEYNSMSRWEVVQQQLKKCEPLLEELKNDQQVTVYVYRFAKDFDPSTDRYTPDDQANGKRTDFGTMLARLYEAHQGERKLRGLIIVSDGADNGTSRPALAEAAKWRGIGCPIYCFGVGQEGSRTDLKDIALTAINPEPSPVPVKSDLTVKALVNAQGFEGANIKVKLLLNDELVKTESFQLLKSLDNEIEIRTKAPDKPGEVKVTLQIVDAPPGEVTTLNNTIETYLTVTREGVRVLYIDVLRQEYSYIVNALGSDKRFDLVTVDRQTDAPLPVGESKKFDLTQEAYDVIILGDVSAARLKSIRPDLMDQIQRLVTERGTGLLMFGGRDSFNGTRGVPGSGDWAGTPVAQVLPVELGIPPQPFDVGDQVNEPTEMIPTDAGFAHYILRLDPTKNKELWKRLNGPKTKLNGFTPFKAKGGAIVFANARVQGKPPVPLLVGMDVGKGRTLAFGAESTGQSWKLLGRDNPKNPKEGLEVNARFWKQMVLWLAHQDEVEGSVYARPEHRRLAVNGRQSVRMGVRDKRGDEIPNANLTYQILAPGEKEDQKKAARPERDTKGQARASFEPKQPGEYIVRVWGDGKDPEGAEVKGEGTARFIVYPDVSDELLRPAAQPGFLLNLENTTNGTSVDAIRRADRLPSFLEEMKNHPLRPAAVKPKLYPDWRRNANPWFLPTLLLIFVAILGVEWGLRRLWGMV